MERCKGKGRGEKNRKEKRGRRRKVRGAGERRVKRFGGQRDKRQDRQATCPFMGDIEDAEDSLARARGQGHMCPWLQEDGCGAARGPQEPVQVSGFMVLDEGQIESGARRLHPGVGAQCSGGRWQQLAVPGFCRAEDQTTTGPVVVRHLAGLVMGADTGVPLVPREASAMAVAFVVDITLCREAEASESSWGRGS